MCSQLMNSNQNYSSVISHLEKTANAKENLSQLVNKMQDEELK